MPEVVQCEAHPAMMDGRGDADFLLDTDESVSCHLIYRSERFLTAP